MLKRAAGAPCPGYVTLFGLRVHNQWAVLPSAVPGLGLFECVCLCSVVGLYKAHADAACIMRLAVALLGFACCTAVAVKCTKVLCEHVRMDKCVGCVFGRLSWSTCSTAIACSLTCVHNHRAACTCPKPPCVPLWAQNPLAGLLCGWRFREQFHPEGRPTSHLLHCTALHNALSFRQIKP